MASSVVKTILLATPDNGFREIHNLPTAVALTPGSLVEETSAGKITPVASANKINQKMFALEAQYEDDMTKLAIEQVIPQDQSANYIYAQPGDKIYARLADSQTIVFGDVLVSSATAGCLQKASAVDATLIEGAAVGVAMEAVTTSGSVGRIRIRVL